MYRLFDEKSNNIHTGKALATNNSFADDTFKFFSFDRDQSIMLIETNENDSLLSGRRVLSSPKGYQIDIQLEGHTYKLRVDIARNSTRWGKMLSKV